jgi:lysophospholipase L1-like esterase
LNKILYTLGACCVLLASLPTPQTSADTLSENTRDFPFRDGDRVVFLGDSITQQRIYTTYIETYLLTRFPTWKLQFRNAGWDGDTAYLRYRGVPLAEALQRDVLDLNPTVVTINFGMNDAGYIGGPFDQGLYDKHVAGETAIVRQLKAAKVRPIIFTPNAIEPNEPGDAMEGYNQLLEQFSAADSELAARENIPFVDQLHPYATAINRIRAIGPDQRITHGEMVHPQQPGQLLMANFLLSGLNAPSLVSSATIDAQRATVRQTEGAKITDIMRRPDGISFRRLDRALVFPIEPATRPALALAPIAESINSYMMHITGLQAGTYSVAVDGKEISRFSATQLNHGVNLGFYDSPLTTAGTKIMSHVRRKNDIYFTLWREVQLGSLPAVEKLRQIDIHNTEIAAEEKAIDALRKPVPFHFEVKRISMPPAKPVTPAPVG